MSIDSASTAITRIGSRASWFDRYQATPRNSAPSAIRSQTESKKAPRGPARPLVRATDPSRMSGTPVRITPITPSTRCPSAMANAVTIAIASPKIVRPSALMPARCRPFPTGSSPRSTFRAPASVEHRTRVPPAFAAAVPQAAISDTHVDCAKVTTNVGVAVPAKTYPTEKLRNVALVGHGGAGKTSLTEALLFVAGTIPRQGRVEDGTTVTDFDPEEARRRISMSLGIAPFEHEGVKINVLDTPGYADFITDVAAAFRAADLAIFVVSAVEGVEVQTEIVWRMAERPRPPQGLLREQARPGTGVVPAHARPAQGQVRGRRRPAPAPDRRGSRVPRRRRPARRHRGALLERQRQG